MDKKIERLQTIQIISAILIVAMLICNVYLTVQMHSVLNRVEILEYGSSYNVFGDSILPSGDIITNKNERNTILDNLTDQLNVIRNNNFYVPMYNSESETAANILIYNKNGESVVQDSTGGQTVYLDDGNMIFFGESIIYGMDCDLISQLVNVVKVAYDGNADLLEGSEVADTSGTISGEYIIDVHGWDNIKKIYEILDEEYATDMVNSMKASLEGTIEQSKLDHPHMRYCFTYDTSTKELLAVSNYFYFGADAVGAWAECYANWGIEGWFEVYDWELPEWWYEYDFINIGDTDGTEAIEQMNSLVDGIQEMLDKFDADNGHTHNAEIGDISSDDSVSDESKETDESSDNSAN